MRPDILTRHDVGVPERTARPVRPTHRGAGELDFSRTVEGPEASQLARLISRAAISAVEARRTLRQIRGDAVGAPWRPEASASVRFAALVYALPEDERAALLAGV